MQQQAAQPHGERYLGLAKESLASVGLRHSRSRRYTTHSNTSGVKEKGGRESCSLSRISRPQCRLTLGVFLRSQGGVAEADSEGRERPAQRGGRSADRLLDVVQGPEAHGPAALQIRPHLKQGAKRMAAKSG
jgi:hypothetical protein